MSMQQNGLAKLIEECGEVLQIAGKMIQYPDLQLPVVHERLFKLHPDGTNLRVHLEEELGDLYAALNFVMKKLQLNEVIVRVRSEEKLALFKQWDKEV